jgi:hypothetical protein
MGTTMAHKLSPETGVVPLYLFESIRIQQTLAGVVKNRQR